MQFKEQILAAIHHEVKIIKHLGAMVKESDLDYRPTPKQRSLGELLSYLVVAAHRGVTNYCNGDKAALQAQAVRSETLKLSDFPDAMDQTLRNIEEAFKTITDDDLCNSQSNYPWGEPVSFGQAIVMVGPQCLTAYRMQLFLYLKSLGHESLTSADCWVGVSQQKA